VSGRRRLQPGEDAHERGLAGPVGAYQADPVTRALIDLAEPVAVLMLAVLLGNSTLTSSAAPCRRRSLLF